MIIRLLLVGFATGSCLVPSATMRALQVARLIARDHDEPQELMFLCSDAHPFYRHNGSLIRCGHDAAFLEDVVLNFST